MNIALDTSALANQHSDRGVGQYTRTLLTVLAEYCPHVRVCEIGKGRPVPLDTDLIHYPYFDPFFLTMPIRKRFRTVVTVHDLTPLVFPSQFPRGIKGELKWWIQKMSLRGVTRIQTDSYNSKKDIIRFTSINENCIDVIRIPPEKIYTRMAVSAGRAIVHAIAPSVKDFVLYVGDVNWNKNIEGIIRAFSLVGKKNNSLKLVLVGSVFMKKTLPEIKKITDLIASFKLNNRVIMPGHVPSESLRAFYSVASCLLFPSYYEGYGLPPLEAMSCGCPVVLGNKGSLPEIHGNEVLVNPYAIESIALGIKQALAKDTPMEKQMRIAWAQTFTEKRMADGLALSYEKALG
jgi:glycosyltransferase involved in cell wall biosynthesis